MKVDSLTINLPESFIEKTASLEVSVPTGLLLIGSYSYIDAPDTGSGFKSDISSTNNGEGISQLKVEWVKLSEVNTFLMYLI